jgi:hypothetical protein
MTDSRNSPVPSADGGAAAPDEKKKMIGKYEMGELLGEGTFSKVKKAVDSTNGNVVAIKIVNNALVQVKRARRLEMSLQRPSNAPTSLFRANVLPQNVKDMERVCREIHVLKNIRHPNIIQLYDCASRHVMSGRVMFAQVRGDRPGHARLHGHRVRRRRRTVGLHREPRAYTPGPGQKAISPSASLPILLLQLLVPPLPCCRSYLPSTIATAKTSRIAISSLRTSCAPHTSAPPCCRNTLRSGSTTSST